MDPHDGSMAEIPELYAVADPDTNVTQPTRAEREAAYNPGPPSTSRKARRKIGARDARPMVNKTIKPSKRKSRRKADNKRRRAIGARGAKTNSIRSGRN